MDLRRLRTGEWLVGAAGLVLLVSLFLPWYELGEGFVAGPPDALDPRASAWDAFSILDVLLALGGLAAIAVVSATAAYRTPAVPLAMQSLLVPVSLILLLLVAFRLADPPDVSFLESPSPANRAEVIEIATAAGGWIALLSLVALFAGALLAIRDERRSPAGRHTDLTGVPVASPRPIETRPAPRPGPET